MIRSLQCQKSLYLYKNHYQLRDPITPEQQAVFDRGHDVGFRAQQMERFREKERIDVSPDKPWNFRTAVSKTSELVAGMLPPVIFEAAFRWNTTLVYLDILEPRNGKWYAYEVKSSRRITPTYIRDAAIQYFVITNCGLKLEDFTIIYVREDFDYQAADSLDGIPDAAIFTERSVLEEILPMQGFVQETIREALHTLKKNELPDICMGEHCDIPYPCDFKGLCSRQESGDLDPSVLAG